MDITKVIKDEELRQKLIKEQSGDGRYNLETGVYKWGENVYDLTKTNGEGCLGFPPIRGKLIGYKIKTPMEEELKRLVDEHMPSRYYGHEARRYASVIARLYAEQQVSLLPLVVSNNCDTKVTDYKEGFCSNKVGLNILNLQDVLEILSGEEVIFRAQIAYLGQDTDFKCVEFDFDSKEYYSFDFYLDLDTHGHTICGGKNQWFYSPKNRQEFMEFLKTGHIAGKE
jgi:hypothetical protein